MLPYPATREKFERVRKFGNHIIEPGYGELASGLTGEGRMAEPEEIIRRLEDSLAVAKRFEGMTVLVTAGPTHEAIDPVRYIGNYASGKMGFAIAETRAFMGPHAH